MQYFSDLSVLASRLRAEGLDARNLGQVGITLWNEDAGYFFPAVELEENAELVTQRDFTAIVARRNGNGHNGHNGHQRRPDVRMVS